MDEDAEDNQTHKIEKVLPIGRKSHADDAKEYNKREGLKRLSNSVGQFREEAGKKHANGHRNAEDHEDGGEDV